MVGILERIYLRMTCKHEKTRYVGSKLLRVCENVFETAHIHKCCMCGKRFGTSGKPWEYK